jgi:hypothetical protein
VPVYEELVARVKGLDVNGNPLKNLDRPSSKQISAIIEEDKALSKSLDDEVITITDERKNGRRSMRELRVGDTMDKFEKTLEDKHNEVVKLIQELKAVDAEIASARAAIAKVENKEIKRAREGFMKELSALSEQAEAAKNQTEVEIKKARKADQANRDKMDSKMEAFLKELMGS